MSGSIRVESDLSAIRRELGIAIHLSRGYEFGSRFIRQPVRGYFNPIDVPVLRVELREGQPIPLASNPGKPEVESVEGNPFRCTASHGNSPQRVCGNFRKSESSV